MDTTLKKLEPEETIYTDSGDCRTYLTYKGDTIKSQTVQDATAILQDNYHKRQHADSLWRASEDFKPYAQIPMATWLQWEAWGITNDQTALKNAIEATKEFKVTNRRL
jgi:hypothetical protein